jgi:hypothetical protein
MKGNPSQGKSLRARRQAAVRSSIMQIPREPSGLVVPSRAQLGFETALPAATLRFHFALAVRLWFTIPDLPEVRPLKTKGGSLAHGQVMLPCPVILRFK